MGWRGNRAALVLGALLFINLLWSGATQAQCLPAIQTPNTVVTCSGSVPTGFAATANLLTINILAGAVINDNGSTGLDLGQRNTISNFGSIITGNATTGILSKGGNLNVISNFGTITTGDDGTAVSFINRNTLTNSGTITVGAGSSLLVSGDSNNTIVNSGTMTTNGGGIFVANRNEITNSGTMTVIGGGLLVSFDSNNTFTNTGTINVDCCGVGVFGNNRNVITNSGTINLGFAAIAIQVGDRNTIVNNGAIIGADGASAIIIANNNTVTNNGTISVTSSGAFAVQGGIDNTIVNNGTITANDGAGGILVFDNSTITNNGTLRATNFAITVFSPGTTNVVLINSGTIDGGFLLGFCGCSGTNVLTNSGLITITDPNMPLALPGIWTVGGTFTNTASGTLAPRVAPGTNNNDSLAADNVILAGTLRLVLQPALYDPVTTYQVIFATTSITGTFAQVVATPFFDAVATYNPNDVTVTLTRLAYGNARGATINQQAVGRALDASFSQGATGDAASIFINVSLSPTTAVLDQLSGEAAAALQHGNFAIGNQFLALMLRQSSLARGGATGGGFARSQDGQRLQYASADVLADASTAQGRAAGPSGPWNAWLAGFGGHVSRDGDSTVGSAHQSIGFAGAAIGLDYRVAPGFLAGAAAAFSGGSYTVADRASSGDSRNIHVGAYGSWSPGPYYVDAALAFAHGDFSTTRTIALGATEQASGAFGGSQFGGRLEAGWRFKPTGFEVTPFAALVVQNLSMDGYNETSRVVATGAPGILGLNVASQGTWSVRSELGGQINGSFTLNESFTLKPRLRLAWAHEFNADRTTTSTLATLPASSFTVSGARAARDAALVTAGVDFGLASNLTGFAQFDGEFSLSGSSFGGAGGLRLTW